MTGSTQFNATIDAIVRKGFSVTRMDEGDEEIGEGPTCYMSKRTRTGLSLAMVEQVSAHDILVNGETLSEFLDGLS